MRKARVLPRDVLISILARLPTKAIVRFLFVCKDWESLIQAPDFQNVLYKLGRKLEFLHFRTLHSLYYYSFDEIGHTKLIYHKEHPPRSPACMNFYIHSCNGLSCYYLDNKTLEVRNLITGEAQVVPLFSCFQQTTPVSMGFGFDTSSKKYKVVFMCLSSVVEMDVFVFTLGSDSWRKLRSVERDITTLDKQSVYAKGALYWLCCKTTGRIPEVGKDTIISFNLVDHSIGEVPLPDNATGYLNSDLCQFKDCLGLSKRYSYDTRQVEIWVLKYYDGERGWDHHLIALPFEVVQPRPFVWSGKFLVRSLKDNFCYLCHLDGQDRVLKTEKLLKLPPNSFYLQNHVGSFARLCGA